MEADDRIFVEEGDRFGFAWDNKGVISFDFLDEDNTGNYCNKAIYPEVGDEVKLKMDKNSDREYSVEVKLCRKFEQT